MENRFSIAGRQPDRQALGSASLAEQQLPANSQEGPAPNIPLAQARADSLGLVALQHPAHGRVLAHVPVSERAQDSEHVQAQAAHLRPVKPRARSAPVPEAAAEASNSTPRPKKAP